MISAGKPGAIPSMKAREPKTRGFESKTLSDCFLDVTIHPEIGVHCKCWVENVVKAEVKAVAVVGIEQSRASGIGGPKKSGVFVFVWNFCDQRA